MPSEISSSYFLDFLDLSMAKAAHNMLALAPANFGKFSNDLLVGNFGDGLIHAFDPKTGDLKGTLSDPAGHPISIEGLWGLKFGNGGSGGDLNRLFFTAGISGGEKVEDHGLFGDLRSVPEPSTLVLCLIALSAALARRSFPMNLKLMS